MPADHRGISIYPTKEKWIYHVPRSTNEVGGDQGDKITGRIRYKMENIDVPGSRHNEVSPFEEVF